MGQQRAEGVPCLRPVCVTRVCDPCATRVCVTIERPRDQHALILYKCVTVSAAVSVTVSVTVLRYGTRPAP